MRIGGLIVCGGLSRRMARDKATLPFGPETMLERMVRIVSQRVQPIVVAAAAGQSLPPLPPEIRIAYDTCAARGPLEGLLSGFTALEGEAEAVFCTSCDAPLLEPEFITHMIARLNDHEIVVPVADGFVHPLAGVYRLSVLPKIRALLEEGNYRLTALLDRSHSNRIEANLFRECDPELRSLRNLNRLEDYRAALRTAGFSDEIE